MFRLAWIQSAYDDLATLWMNADSQMRYDINQLVRAAERELQIDPFAVSESRGPGEWVCFFPPLGFLLEIDINNRVVWVLAVWRF